jgi:hypothetical protein
LSAVIAIELPIPLRPVIPILNELKMPIKETSYRSYWDNKSYSFVLRPPFTDRPVHKKINPSQL